MRPTHLTALLGASIMIAACGPGSETDASDAALETDGQKVSYALGRNFAETLGDRLDLAALRRGMQDVRNGVEPPIPDAEMQQVMQRVQMEIQQEQQAEREAEAEENRQAEEAFLAENAEKEGVTVTESGLQYEVLEEGDGASPEPGDQVTVHYRGTLTDGTEFDSSMGGEPATFGVTGVIPGFSEGLQLMSVGGRYRLYIPSDLGYGPQGQPPSIPPGAALVFEVELLGVE